MRLPFKEEKLIISLYDYTGAWVNPYVKAGYPVLLWDKKIEGDIIECWGSLIGVVENAIDAGYYPYGLIAAPPCDDFAVSGARWFKIKDESFERCGYKDICGNSVDMHVLLVECVLLLMEQIKQLTGHEFTFWALENPVGRIEKLVPSIKPFRKLLFNPCDFGDAYTKKTILWGNFNHQLKKQPVEPIMYELNGKRGSYAWAKLGGKSERTKALRSATPAGFAKAFFEANN